MEDAMRVFCRAPDIGGYVKTFDGGTPQFQFVADIQYCGVKNDEIINFTDQWRANIEGGDSAATVYGDIYFSILKTCSDNSWPAPAKSDIFCFVPTPLSVLLPDEA